MLVRTIKLVQKAAYFAGLGALGGIFVIERQPKNPEVDHLFLVGLSITMVTCLGLVVGLGQLEKRMSRRP